MTASTVHSTRNQSDTPRECQPCARAAASLAGHLGRMQMQPDGRVVEAPREANQTGTYRAARLLECLERGEDPGTLALDAKNLAAHKTIKSAFMAGGGAS
jgi:hypothetical protein